MSFEKKINDLNFNYLQIYFTKLIWIYEFICTENHEYHSKLKYSDEKSAKYYNTKNVLEDYKDLPNLLKTYVHESLFSFNNQLPS